MPRLRLLDLAKPFMAAMPEVQAPLSKIDFQERIIWTVSSGILFHILSEMPLYGVPGTMAAADPIAGLRGVLAASAGTPLELGVIPVLLSGFVLQVLAGRRTLNVSLDLRSDRTLFQSAQKLLAMLLAFVLSLLVVLSGTYGAVQAIGYQQAVVLVMQVFIGSLYVIFSDELLSKGYGVGTGVLLYTTLSSTQKFAWSLLSMQSVDTVFGPQTVGALPNLVSSLMNRSWTYGLVHSTFRSYLPSFLDIATAVVAFGAIILLSSMRQDLQVRSTKMRAQSSVFPIRLLYAGAQPVLFWAASLATLRLVAAALFRIAPDNLLVTLLGKWTVQGYGAGSALVPTSGLVYYLDAPTSWLAAARDPLRVATFVLSTVAVSAWFGVAWAESSGFAPVDIAKQFKENGIVIVGRRDVSALKELKRVIPLAAGTGGAALGAYVAGLDVFGAAGWGSTISVSVLNFMALFELLSQDGYNPQV